MSKFSIGDRVFIFNSISCEIESDVVYAILYAPIANAGVEQDQTKSIKQRIEDGEMSVHEQCQTLQHQILDADILFASESDAKEFYRKLLAD